MSYIGVQATNRLSPNFVKEDFVGTGATANFTLTNEVPGGASENVMVMVKFMLHGNNYLLFMLCVVELVHMKNILYLLRRIM